MKWSGAVGYADAERSRAANAQTLYRIGSISKTFADTLVMQLVDRGALDLDAPVQKYLPDFKPRNPFNKPITLRLLMTHRSGLVREPPRGSYFDTKPATLAETVRSLNTTTLVAEPGSVFKYSNAGFAVVGRIVEVVGRKPYEKQIQRALLTPLGMKSTFLRATDAVRARLAYSELIPYDAERFAAPLFDLGMAPAGNLYSSVEDLGRFATSLLKRKEGTESYGISYFRRVIDGHRIVSHSGAVYGFMTDLAVLPDDGFAVITFVAVDDGSSALTRLRDFTVRQVLAARSGERAPRYVASDDVPLSLARQVAGHYSDGMNSLDLRVVDKRTYIEAPEVVSEVRREGARWVLDDVGTYRNDVTIDPFAATVTLGGVTYRRAEWKELSPPSQEFAPLIGEYGWDHNVIRIYERDGQPYVRIEWSSHEALERVSPDVYRFPRDHGLYPLEELRFTRDADGMGVRVSLNGILFERHDFGAEFEAKTRASAVGSLELRAQALAAKPPAQPAGLRKPDLVEVAALEPTVHLDVRYASTNNFMGMVFYPTPQVFLQKPAAEALIAAHRELMAQYGFGILFHDGYRPWYVTKMFWGATPPAGRAFVADPSQGSRHNRGCAADITLYDTETGKVLEMAGRYDEMSARSSPLYLGGTSQQRWRRDVLKNAMEAHGYDVYMNEWWHFDFAEWPRYPVLNIDFPAIGK